MGHLLTWEIIMAEILALAVVVALGVLFLVFKFGPLRRVLAFDAVIDVVATTVLFIGMMGTFAGVTIALVAGTIISISLWGLKRLIGADTLTPRGWVTTERPPRRRVWRRFVQ